MKLVLSRKGFDSGRESGGCPSPIFPDGTMCSLPIPDRSSEIAYSTISPRGIDLGRVLGDLTGNALQSSHQAHLDPDIERDSLPRGKGWRPLFGQTGAAQGHLRNQQVGIGDLFLFFGLFRAVEQAGGVWRFVKEARMQHVIWGWLRVAEIHKVDELKRDELTWARYHPHFSGSRGSNNTLYVATDKLRLGGRHKNVAGAGIFPRYEKRLVLTDPANGASCRQWRLPSAFYPDSGKPPLSYHGRLSRWSQSENEAWCGLQSVSRGQEFVLDLKRCPGVVDWLRSLMIY